MTEIYERINSREDAEKLILRSESEFFSDLANAIETVFEGEVPKIIALSGPTCSGKTTTAGMLTERIRRSGHQAVVMSIDDFFKNQNSINVVKGESPDYDSVNAIDLEYLGRVVSRLDAGKEALIPTYSFPVAARTGYREYYPDENDIYVYEGIQAVYPEVVSLFAAAHKSIFICVNEGVSYRGVTLTAHEIRLLRRLVRDYRFRNATAEFSLHLWEGVRENEDKHIFPNAGAADVYINSFLEYEPFIIAPIARELLETVDAASRYRAQADELREKLKVFDNPYFDDRMIPQNSVFREFIG